MNRLPIECINLIYEFDSTNRDNFNKVVDEINNLCKFDHCRGLSHYGNTESYLTKSYTIGVLEDGIEVIEYRKYFYDDPDYFTDEEDTDEY